MKGKNALKPSDVFSGAIQRQEVDLNRALAGIDNKHDASSKIPGTRPTFFTNLSTTSYKSQLSLERKPHLEQYYSIRIFPSRVILDQYEPGKIYELTFKIKNCSKIAEYVTVTATQTRFFQLDRKVPMGEILIAPGLEKHVTVHFLAPDLPSADDKSTEDPSVRLYMDRIFVQSRSKQKILVPFEAYPCVPQLELTDNIEFGTVFQAFSEIGIEKRSIKSLENISGWISKDVIIRNVGRRTATFISAVPKEIPLRVVPSRFTLRGEDSVDSSDDPSAISIRIEYLPIYTGKMDAAIIFKPEREWPRPKTSTEGLERTVSVSSFVLKHCARILGVEHVDISHSNLSFGTIYFGEKVTSNITIINCSPTTFRWSLVLDVESIPRVPGEDSNRDPALNQRYALNMTPAEGELLPGENGLVQISFQGKSLKRLTGFKSHLTPEDDQKYDIKLLLTFYDSNGMSIPSATPIHLSIHAKCTPVFVRMSTDRLQFPSLKLGEQSQTHISIANDAVERDMFFEFMNMTHFRIQPNHGKVLPGQSKNLKVIFSPRQNGIFEEHVECLIKSTNKNLGHWGVMTDPESSKIKVLETLHLVLKGICEQHVGKKYMAHEAQDFRDISPVKSTLLDKSPLSRGVKTARSILSGEDRPRTHREWNEKQNHKFHYISYIRSSRQHRLTKSRDRYFHTDGIPTDLSELPLMGHTDKENGLIPPEPTASISSGISPPGSRGRLKTAPRQHTAASTPHGSTGHSKRLTDLFHQLYKQDTDLAKPVAIPILNQSSFLEQSLDPEQLANIYAPSTEINFGTLTVHTQKSILFNILNANTNASVHVCFEESSISRDQINISPAFHIIPPMSIHAFDISLKQNRAGIIDTTLVYKVNGRYRYHLRVKADIRPVRLEVDSTLIVADIDLDHDPQLQRLLHRDWNTSTAVDMPGADDHGSRASLLQDSLSPQIPYVQKSIKLFNPGTHSSRFDIIGGTTPQTEFAEGKLDFFPRSGIIAPNSRFEVNVQFTPGIKPILERQLKIRVYDDDNNQSGANVSQVIEIQFKGSVCQSNCVVLTSSQQGPMDLGILPPFVPPGLRDDLHITNHLYSSSLTQISKSSGTRLGMKGHKVIKIKNTSSSSCFFLASLSSPTTDLTISPQSGIISRDGGILDLTVEASPREKGTIENTILVHIIGSGKTLRIPIKYECRGPEIDLQEFASNTEKGVIIGSSRTNMYLLKNTGSALARLIFDLRGFSELSMGIVSVQEQRPSKPLSSRHRKNNESISAEALLAQRYMRVIMHMDDFTASPAQKHDLDIKGALYVVDTLPGEIVTLSFTHHPNIPGSYTFHIPARVLGLEEQSHFIQFTSIALASPVALSQKEIVFPNKIIQRPPNNAVSTIPYKPSKMTISFKNLIKEQLEWMAHLISEPNSPQLFRLDGISGWLNPGQSQELSVSFLPEHPGSHEAHIELELSYGTVSSHIKIPIHANSLEPCLTFEPPEVFLPIRPFSQESTAIISIINYGCERNEVKYNLSFDVQDHGGILEVLFPEGKLLKSDGEKLTCMIRFIANENHSHSLNESKSTSSASNQPPCSFITKLVFGEPGKRQFFLPIHGIADKSQATLAPFLWENNATYTYQQIQPDKILYDIKEKETQVDENHRRLKIINGPRPFKTPAGIPLNDGAHALAYESYVTKLAVKLLAWLREHTGVHVTAQSFPSILTNNSNKVAIELLHSISGKKIAGISAHHPFTSCLDEKVKHAHKQNIDIINHLTSLGASLASVKAEYLLCQEDFKRYLATKLTFLKNELGINAYTQALAYYNLVDANFTRISKEAWLILLLQMFRVYVLIPINLKQLRSTVGIQKEKLTDNLFTRCNVYDTPEQILLAWASYHYQRSSESDRVLRHFVDDFHDSIALIHVILSHMPQLSSMVKLATMDASDQSQEKRMSNAGVLISLFRQIYGPDAHISNLKPVDIVEGNQFDFIFILSLMYQTLPQILNKQNLDFHGFLHEKIVRTIELSNPANRPLVYSVEVGGSPEYKVACASITIPPKSEGSIDVEFISRFCRTVQGYLIMKTKSMGFNISSFIVYSLKANIEPPTPTRIFKIEAPLYCSPASVHNISISNPFPEKGTFTIQTRYKRRLSPQEEKLIAKMDHISPSPFKIEEEELTLGPHQTAHLPIIFLPFDHGYHDCNIFFFDRNVGEFLYKVEAKATLPTSIETINWTTKAGVSVEKFIHITPNNPQRDRALYAAFVASNTTKASAAVHGKSHTRSKVLSATTIERESYQLPRRPLRYKIEYSSTYFHGPTELIIKPPQQENNKMFSMDQNQSELPVSFKPVSPGKYVCKIVLNCTELSDVRVYSVEGIARSEGSHAELDFTIPARQSVTQDIPIINRSDEDWTIKSSLLGMYFSCPYSLVAKARSVTNFPLTFSPLRPLHIDGSLILSNMHTNQTYTYQMKGNVLEPLPEEHRDIEVETRSFIDQSFPIKNSLDKEMTFSVETDLSCVQGDKTIRVGPGETKLYPCRIFGRSTGSFSKVIKFISQPDQFMLWFKISLQVKKARPESSISLKCAVRETSVAQILIKNPLKTSIQYDVDLQGEFVTGARSIVVEPKSEALYALSFAPMITSQHQGKISFSHPDVGEFWYELVLEAVEPPPTNLAQMTCAIGKYTTQTFEYKNPLDHDLTITLSNSNTRDFIIQHPVVNNIKDISRRQPGNFQLTLKPQEMTSFQLVFWPTSLTETMDARIDVYSREAGKSVFLVKGESQLPKDPDHVIIRSNLHRATTGFVSFSNPFIDPITVSVSLQTKTQLPESKDIQLMMTRRQKISIMGLERFDIPFSYSPKAMSRSNATIEIEMNSQLKWCYQIEGIPLSDVTMPPQDVVSRVGSSEVIHIYAELQGILPEDSALSNSIFDPSIESSIHDMAALTSQIKFSVEACEKTTRDMLRVGIMVTFSPNRPMNLASYLVLNHNHDYGQWKIPIRLIADPPPPQEVITIEGSTYKTTFSTLFVSNQSHSENIKFRAYFTQDSSPEFSVTPEKGTLSLDEKRQGDENKLTIQLNPSMAGKILVGILIVETNAFTTAYEVRGVTPLTRPSSSGNGPLRKQSYHSLKNLSSN